MRPRGGKREGSNKLRRKAVAKTLPVPVRRVGRSGGRNHRFIRLIKRPCSLQIGLESPPTSRIQGGEVMRVLIGNVV